MGSISLGKIFGIPLRLHYTWFFVFILITSSLIAYLPVQGTYILWYRIVFGVIASLIFFMSILAHELAHSLVAVKNNIPVKDITLFIFGGVSQMSKEASRPTTEILIAIVGPLCSIVIAGIFHTIYILLLGVDELIATMAQWLAYINAFMAMFNLIPGFPLDGGRIFRSIMWLRTGDYVKATRSATVSGRIIGYVFIAGGIIIMFITHAWISGLWLAFIGWFLETAASTSYRETLLRDSLEGFTAEDIMAANCPFIPREINLGQLVQNYMIPTGNRCFVVITDDTFEGLVTLRNIKRIPQERWDTTTAGEIMTPSHSLPTASPTQDALSLIQHMEEKNIDQVPVISSGKFIGMISRDNLTRLPRIRTDLKI